MTRDNQHKLLKNGNYRYLLVPVELCRICIKERLTTGLQIYILLKAISAGHLKVNRTLKLQMKQLFSVTERTINNNLQRLLERNWIGYNAKNNTYHIRSFDTIAVIEEFRSRIAGEFKVTGIHFQQTDLTRMKAFAAGALVGYCAYLATLKKNEGGLGRCG